MCRARGRVQKAPLWRRFGTTSRNEDETLRAGEELFDDPHLKANDGLLPITVTDGERAGQSARLPALPLEMDGHRFGIHRDVPRKGQHTREIMAEAGYSEDEIAVLIESGAVGAE